MDCSIFGGRVTADNFDPLRVIFEKHFFESESREECSLCKMVVDDYFNYLSYSGAIVPRAKEDLIKKEVELEVKEILIEYQDRYTLMRAFLSNSNDIKELKRYSNEKYLSLF